jgi:RNA polymerase sigma-70 factor (ECF subfamily)
MGLEAEAELLRRCRQGDTVAWDELFDLHYNPAARFVFQLGHTFTREDAEEICQEAFLAVIKNIHTFQGECQFQTWLFRIAANKARDYRERQGAAKRGGGRVPVSLQAEDPETGLTLDPPATTPAPDAVLLTSEQAGLLQKAIDELDPPCV